MWRTRETVGTAAKVAACVAGGTIVGVGLGLLFAPRAGVETRRAVSRQAKRAQVSAIRMGRAVQQGMKSGVAAAKEQYKGHRSSEEPMDKAA
ncbi:MAG: YtxH domain-containing protein [Nitrospiraceae bacterium]